MQGTTSRVPPAARHIARALTVAIIGALLASLGASRLTADASATSRVAVSDEVGWPFYTTARDSLLEIALDPEVHDDVRRAVGADETTLEFDAGLTGGEISVDLTVRSADAATAAAAANLYAETVVARGSQEALAEAEQRLRGLRIQLEAIDARAQANDAELLRLGTELDVLGDAAPEGARLVLESQIQRIDTALAEDARRRAQLVQDLPSAEADAVDASSDYEVVRVARSPGGDVLSDAGLMALLAGLPLFLIGLGASVLWDQTLGVVRRPRDVRWAADAPVFAIGYGSDDQVVDPSPLTRLSARQQIPGSVWTIEPVGRNPRVVTLSSSLADVVGDRLWSPVDADRPETDRSGSDRSYPPPLGTSGRPAAGDAATSRPTVAGSESESAELLTELLTDARSESLHSPRGPATSSSVTQPAAAVSGAVVTVLSRGVRLPRLRRAVRDLALEGIPVEAVVIFEPER
jgi:hypothetical protein